MKRKMASFIVVLALFSATTYALAINQTTQKDIGVILGSKVEEKTDAKPQLRPSHSTSVDWAGYAVVTDLAAPTRGSVTDVVGQWTVPSVSASRSSSYSAVWVGIDGYTSSTIQQIGTSQDNPEGIPQYYAWYEIAPDPPIVIDIIVSPGDSMSAEVSYIGDNQFTFKLNNLTTGESFSTTKTVNADRLSAEWVVEAPSSSMKVLPLADFGSVTFHGAQATLNGHTGSISDENWQFDPIRLINRTGAAVPSAPTADGAGFTVSWGGGSADSTFGAIPATATDVVESADTAKPTATAKPTTKPVRQGTSTGGPPPIHTVVPTATIR